MRTREILAVVIGGITDIVVTNVLTFPLMVYIIATSDLTGTAPDQVGTRVFSIMHDSSRLQVTGWALGLCATVLGGYMAALLAKRDEVKFGAMSAWLCMSLGVYSLLSPSVPTAPMWQHILAFVLSPTFGAVGGLIRRHQLRARTGRGGGLTPAIVPG